MRFGIAAIAFVALAVAGIGGAQASCAVGPSQAPMREQLNTATVVFVGTVIYTSDNNRTARVRVDSIWKGPTLPAYVDVNGEAPGSGPFSGSEGDHMYRAGEQVLFVPVNDSPPFQDYGECASLTQTFTADLAAYAPADARSPRPVTLFDEVRNGASEYWLPAALGVLIVLGAVVVFRLSSRKQPVQ